MIEVVVMVMTFLQYMGGKSYIKDWIISVFPKHKCYVEVFGGGASVLIAKKPSKVEVYNDIWGDVVNLFTQVRDNLEEMKRYLLLSMYSRQVFNEFLTKYKKRSFRDDVERAAITFYLLNVSMNGLMTDFSTTSTNSSTKKNKAKTYFRKIYSTIDKVAERFRNVVIENLDFRDVIEKYDTDGTLFYCDPPYFGTEDYYHGSFTYKDHVDLYNLLSNINGKVIVSYYPHPRILELYKDDKWRILKKQIPKWSKRTPTREIATEILILNYEPPKVSYKQKTLDFLAE